MLGIEKMVDIKKSKKLLLGAVLMLGCLGTATTGFAEAKAFDVESVLRGSYDHTQCNEFFIRTANMYNAALPDNSWGEFIVREESGMDGSVTRSWLIGDLKRDGDNNFVLQVKRQVIQKIDGSGQIQQSKVENVDYDLQLYHRLQDGFKCMWDRKGTGPCTDVDGEYVSSLKSALMSREAALYVLQRFMNQTPAYRQKLEGAAMQLHGHQELSDIHVINLVEQHPDHIVTRGSYEVDSDGSISEYDVATDKWNKLTP